LRGGPPSGLQNWGASMYAAETTPPWLLLAALAVGGSLLIGGLLYWAFSARRTLRQREKELAAIVEDLHERSIAEEALKREVSRLKRIPKAELLPMLQLAHELRSPLAAIQNSLDMILQGYAANDPKLQDEMLDLARDRATAMMARVNDFMRLGAVQHAEIERKVQPVQLLDVVWRLVPEMRVKATWRAVDFAVDVPESLPSVRGTYEDMEHLVSNLINNAIKYTEPGGIVTVSLREKDDSIIGAVEDTGIGIAPEDLPRIFDDFYRSKHAKDMDAHGTGLGLSIAKRVADLYGGQLDVESQLGRGSKFSFRFPKAEAIDE
jgi:signal transduction histidine kinase